MKLYNYLLNMLLLTAAFSTTKTYIACEGQFYGGSGSISVIQNNNTYSIDNLGNTLQSIEVYEDMLFAIVNGTSEIHIYNINNEEETLLNTINTGSSGPREMAMHNGYLYFTNWYSQSIKYIDLNTFEIIGEILVDGLPEDIVSDGDHIWVTINMNSDWSDGNKVLKINTETIEVEEYIVGQGPKNLILHEDEVYISRIYYDENWNTFHGTSRINSDGSVDQINYGSGMACGGSIVSYNNQIYRSYDGGIAPLNTNLEIQESLRIGDYGYWNVYDVKTIDDEIYFAITDFSTTHQVAIVDSDGNEIGLYSTGVIPGDFAKWTNCIANGDYNQDGEINVSDVVGTVSVIVGNAEWPGDCSEESADINGNGIVDVVDVVQIVQLIVGGRVQDATAANIIKTFDSVSLKSDGFIGAVQMTLAHNDEFSIDITNDALVAEYNTTENSTTLIIVNPESEKLFSAEGSFEITDVIVVNSKNVIENSITMPNLFNLSAAYPNPFNPTTSFSLDLPIDSHVSINVYNATGQIVGTIANEYMKADIYNYSWNASNLPSGVYFINAEIGSNLAIQKLTLLK